MHREKYTLIVPSWYPTPEAPLTGIFVQKHVQLISTFIKCVVLYAAEGDSPPKKNERGSIIEYTFYYKPQTVKPLNQLVQIQALWNGYKSIVNEYGPPAAIHNHVVFPAGYVAWAVSQLYNIPLLITEHWTGYCDPDGRYKLLSPLHHFITRRTFAKAKAVSVVTNYLKSCVQALGLASGNTPFLITPNTLNEANPVSNIRAFNPACPKAVYIGNLDDPQKNISGLIEATALVMQQFPGFTLTLIGDGNERKLFETKAAKAGLLNTHVFFKGSIPNNELPEYYRAADFFVLNSNFETFSIAAAEALTNGVPVVSTRCGGPEEFINNSNGILTEMNNPAKLAGAIIKMIENYAGYNGAAIAEQMKAAYSNRVVTEQFKKMYSYI